MIQRLIETTETLSVTGTVYGTAYDMNQVSTLSVQSVIDVVAQTAGNFASTDVSTVNDTITIAGKAFPTGLVGQFTTSGTLPTGVVVVTNYYVISDGTTAFKFATSFANAQAGTAIDLTAAGAGNSTFTPTALAGGTISFQRSNKIVDGAASTTAADWDDIDTATAVTADANVWYSVVGPTYRWFRIKGVVTANYYSGVNYILARGESKS